MKTGKRISNIGKGLTVILLVSLFTTMGFGQHLAITGGTFSGTGTYNVAGNITNTGAAAVAGTVTLNGTSAQAIGTSSNGQLSFTNLNVNTTTSPTATMNVAVAVSTALSIASGTTLAAGANNLTIGGTSTLNGGGFLTTSSGGTVTYNSAGAGQIVLGGFTYNGGVTLSGGTKTISSTVTVGQAFSHTGGLLTISGGGVALGTTGAFDATTISSGTITGGSGLATFNGLLTKTGGNLTSGSGGISLLAGLTNTSGNITVGASQSLSIAGAVSYTAGTLSFDAASSVTYGALATTVLDASYGNLTLNSDAKSWGLGSPRTISGNLTLGASAATNVTGANDLTVLGNVSLAANLTKAANAVLFTNASSAVSGTGYEIVGAVTRTHAFVVSTPYTFNNARTIVTPTAITSLTSFTLNSQPSTNPTGYVNGNSVNRTYVPTYTSTGFTANLQLAYLSGEYTGSNASKIKQFQGGISSGNKKTGTYSRSTGDGFSFVELQSLTDVTLAQTSQLALDDRFTTFTSIASGNWNAGGTWSEGSIPTSVDEVVIANTFPVTVPDGYAAAAISATINATSGLTVGQGAATTLAIGSGGLTNNSGGTGLTVNANAVVTITGASLTNSGAVTNNGTITIQ